jgi:hypothetical protein
MHLTAAAAALPVSTSTVIGPSGPTLVSPAWILRAVMPAKKEVRVPQPHEAHGIRRQKTNGNASSHRPATIPTPRSSTSYPWILTKASRPLPETAKKSVVAS